MHASTTTQNGDDIDGEVFGFVAKSALLLADGLAVVLGASPEVNGCGIGFHTYRHGRSPSCCFRKSGDFFEIHPSPVAPTHKTPGQRPKPRAADETSEGVWGLGAPLGHQRMSLRAISAEIGVVATFPISNLLKGSANIIPTQVKLLSSTFPDGIR